MQSKAVRCLIIAVTVVAAGVWAILSGVLYEL
jgi:hypothetical protein